MAADTPYMRQGEKCDQILQADLGTEMRCEIEWKIQGWSWGWL